MTSALELENGSFIHDNSAPCHASATQAKALLGQVISLQKYISNVQCHTVNSVVAPYLYFSIVGGFGIDLCRNVCSFLTLFRLSFCRGRERGNETAICGGQQTASPRPLYKRIPQQVIWSPNKFGPGQKRQGSLGKRSEEGTASVAT